MEIPAAVAARGRAASGLPWGGGAGVEGRAVCSPPPPPPGCTAWFCGAGSPDPSLFPDVTSRRGGTGPEGPVEAGYPPVAPVPQRGHALARRHRSSPAPSDSAQNGALRL